jgi:hypothetical protein
MNRYGQMLHENARTTEAARSCASRLQHVTRAVTLKAKVLASAD